MQELAIHLEHFKGSALGGLQGENCRTAETYKDEVDRNLSPYNFQAGSGLPMQKVDYAKAVKSVLIGLGCREELRKARSRNGSGRKRKVLVYPDGKAIRSNVNYLSSMVVTVSRETAQEWGEKKTRAYFKACSDFMRKRFAVIDDKVHVDEPKAGKHAHINFVPLKDGKLNSDGLFKRADLKALHTEMARYLQEQGFEVVRGVDGGKKLYTRHLDELKNEQEKLYQQVNATKQEVREIVGRCRYATKNLGLSEDRQNVVVPTNDFNKLVQMAELGGFVAEATKEKEHAHKRADYQEKQNAEIREKAQELEQKQEAHEKELAKANNKGYNKALQDNARDIRNGKLIGVVTKYDDLQRTVERAIAEAQGRDRQAKISVAKKSKQKSQNTR